MVSEDVAHDVVRVSDDVAREHDVVRRWHARPYREGGCDETMESQRAGELSKLIEAAEARAYTRPLLSST
jgi:hypothetical protein